MASAAGDMPKAHAPAAFGGIVAESEVEEQNEERVRSHIQLRRASLRLDDKSEFGLAPVPIKQEIKQPIQPKSKRSRLSCFFCCSSVREEEEEFPIKTIPTNPALPDRVPLLEPLLVPPGQRIPLCVVLDMDETLVHSSFEAVEHADFTLHIKLDSVKHTVYVSKRPFVDEFLSALASPEFEIVVFTASLDAYAGPLLDILDVGRVISKRLFREACSNVGGVFVKDLSLLGRPLSRTVIVDNSPTSYMLQPQNAVPVTSWFFNQEDTELRELLPILKQLALEDDVRLDTVV